MQEEDHREAQTIANLGQNQKIDAPAGKSLPPKHEIYQEKNVGTCFVSFDIIKANFNAMKYAYKIISINNVLTGIKEEDFPINNWDNLLETTFEPVVVDFLKMSKRFRQLVFGTCPKDKSKDGPNFQPSKQQAIQRHLMLKFITELEIRLTVEFPGIKKEIKGGLWLYQTRVNNLYTIEFSMFRLGSDEVIIKFDQQYLTHMQKMVTTFEDWEMWSIWRTEFFSLEYHICRFCTSCNGRPIQACKLCSLISYYIRKNSNSGTISIKTVDPMFRLQIENHHRDIENVDGINMYLLRAPVCTFIGGNLLMF